MGVPVPPEAFRLGVNLSPYYAERGGLDVVGQARLAEDVGFADLWCPDHIVFRRPIGDVQVMAAMAAAVTDRLQICLGVVQAGMRHPVALAKWIGALAHEAPGRVLAGLGVGGDFRDEWLTVGVDPRERGRRLDELLAVLPALLANKPVAHRGDVFAFDVEPMFGSAPETVPIWIGARVDAAIKRAALVDGWFGMIRWPEEFATIRQQLLDAATADHRPPPQTGIALVASVLGTDEEAKRRCGEFFRSVYGLPADRGDKRSIGGLGRLRELIAQYREAGADRVALMIIDPPSEAWPKVAAACLA